MFVSGQRRRSDKWKSLLTGQIQNFFYQKCNLNLFFTWFQKIIRMPPDVSKAEIVIHFFEMWGTDHRSNPKSSEIFDPAVGRYVFNAFNSVAPRSKTYLGHYQRSMMGLLTKIGICLSLTSFAKNFIIDVWKGPKYASAVSHKKLWLPENYGSIFLSYFVMTEAVFARCS